MRNLTSEEEAVLKQTENLANECVNLPNLIGEDIGDIFYHIRAIQNIIYARPAFELQNKPVKV